MKEARQALDVLLSHPLMLVLRVMACLAGIAVLLWPEAQGTVRTAAGTLVAAAICLFVLQVAISLSRDLGDQIAYALERRKYDYSYEVLTVKARLDETTGKVRVHRHVHLRATSEVVRVRHYLHALSESLQGALEIRDFRPIKPAAVKTRVERVSELSNANRMVIEVTFAPPLGPGHTAIYEVEEEFPPGSFVSTAEEMADRQLPFEYFSWAINKPTRRLRFEISIPKSLHATECEYDVWYGGYTQQRHRQEWERVRPCFDTVKTDASYYTSICLDVPFPVLGIVYVLRWRYA